MRSSQRSQSLCTSSTDGTGLQTLNDALSPEMGLMKKAHVCLQLGVTLPKLYPAFEVEEFMRGAEAAFHAFNTAFYKKEWGTSESVTATRDLPGISDLGFLTFSVALTVNAIASEKLATVTREVMEHFEEQGTTIVCEPNTPSGYDLEDWKSVDVSTLTENSTCHHFPWHEHHIVMQMWNTVSTIVKLWLHSFTFSVCV